VGECGNCVRGREASQRSALVWVEKAGYPGYTGESGIHYPLQDLGESLEQDYDTEGRGGVIRGLPWFVEHDTIGPFEGKWVGTICHQGCEQVVDQVRCHAVHPLPYRVGDHVRPRGR